MGWTIKPKHDLFIKYVTWVDMHMSIIVPNLNLLKFVLFSNHVAGLCQNCHPLTKLVARTLPMLTSLTSQDSPMAFYECMFHWERGPTKFMNFILGLNCLCLLLSNNLLAFMANLEDCVICSCGHFALLLLYSWF